MEALDILPSIPTSIPSLPSIPGIPGLSRPPRRRRRLDRVRRFISALAHLPRRLTPRRLALGTVLGGVSLQATVVLGVSVVAWQRRRRRRFAGFPYIEPSEVRLGENVLRLFTYGQDLYDAMIESIDAARECIYFETFIWKDDEVGRRFKAHLTAKAEQGVQVYIIMDTFGNMVVPRQFKEFAPGLHVLKFWGLRRPWHLLDPRRYAVDHRKLLIVDGHVGYVGGYNVGALYAARWRDTHLKVVGPAAMDLAQAFIDFWNRFAHKREHITQYYPRTFNPLFTLRGNDSMRLTFPVRDMYIDAIDRAQSHIYLTNAYFIPDHILLEALEAAAQRGVDVQILLPWTSNHTLADWASRGYFTHCLEAGIRIFGYRDAMIHAKTCTVDGEWTTIGTANLDRLSSLGNYEINAEIYSRELAREMEMVFASDKTNAFELTTEHWLSRPWYVKLSEQVLKPFRLVV